MNGIHIGIFAVLIFIVIPMFLAVCLIIGLYSDLKKQYKKSDQELQRFKKYHKRTWRSDEC
ncbi:hypothetical protein [Moraxella sp. K2450]|uniref:hypothetical protein n=1 Tax=Moraxella sp. K2450 TaxID=2780076 RepID=UPI00187F0C16|nr:hypothetical protein [Moraxella sp. K2450]MBE9597160.1 hypothetical protein [Moraxella sp. K2450]